MERKDIIVIEENLAHQKTRQSVLIILHQTPGNGPKCFIISLETKWKLRMSPQSQESEFNLFAQSRALVFFSVLIILCVVDAHIRVCSPLSHLSVLFFFCRASEVRLKDFKAVFDRHGSYR